MPVLPEVGSMMVVLGVIFPSFSPAAIIAAPIRSLTLPSGLKNSHLRAMVAGSPAVTRCSFTNGVFPTVPRMESWMGMGAKVEAKNGQAQACAGCESFRR